MKFFFFICLVTIIPLILVVCLYGALAKLASCKKWQAFLALMLGIIFVRGFFHP